MIDWGAHTGCIESHRTNVYSHPLLPPPPLSPLSLTLSVKMTLYFVSAGVSVACTPGKPAWQRLEERPRLLSESQLCPVLTMRNALLIV